MVLICTGVLHYDALLSSRSCDLAGGNEGSASLEQTASLHEYFEIIFTCTLHLWDLMSAINRASAKHTERVSCTIAPICLVNRQPNR